MKALPSLVISLLLMISTLASADAPGQDIEERLKPCAACHGENGHSPSETYAPSIAGKPAGYLHKQLINFRDGRRHQREMGVMLAYLTDDYLYEMASYYAAQSPVTARRETEAPAELLAQGRKLAEQGAPARDIPACQDCHGKTLTGVEPFIPGLLGLSSEYVSAQLGAWRAGVRKAEAPDCMAEIVRRMSAEDMTAVAAWIASRPTSHSPPGKVTPRLPMECGGIQ